METCAILYTCIVSSYLTLSVLSAGCSGRVDLAIIIDTSASMRSERFYRVLEYLCDLIEELELSKNKTRIGVISYSDNATVQFYFNKYSSIDDVTAAIKRIPYNGGKSNVASAFKIMVELGFLQYHYLFFFRN